MGPSCLRRAVKAGTLGIEALTELTSEQRETKRRKATRIKPEPRSDTRTPDLFDYASREAIDALHKAAADCLCCGVVVSYTIED